MIRLNGSVESGCYNFFNKQLKVFKVTQSDVLSTYTVHAKIIEIDKVVINILLKNHVTHDEINLLTAIFCTRKSIAAVVMNNVFILIWNRNRSFDAYVHKNKFIMESVLR